MTKSQVGKKIFCAECWTLIDKEVCDCGVREYYPGKPYFCGHCLAHVSGISVERLLPIIKLIKKSRIKIPGEIADYSWGDL